MIDRELTPTDRQPSAVVRLLASWAPDCAKNQETKTVTNLQQFIGLFAARHA